MTLNIRYREGMPPLLRDLEGIVAVIKDDRYIGLLGQAANLREQLSIAAYLLENLPGITVNTSDMREVLEKARVED